jgi:hypothetical protein
MKLERLPYMWDRISDNYERRTRTIKHHVWTWIHQFCISQIPMKKNHGLLRDRELYYYLI